MATRDKKRSLEAKAMTNAKKLRRAAKYVNAHKPLDCDRLKLELSRKGR